MKGFKAQGIWQVRILLNSLFFIVSNTYQIEDVAGNDEVTLVRKFGNETCVYVYILSGYHSSLHNSIRLMFSIADIQAEQEADFEELPEGEEASEDQPSHSYPIRCSFAITKVSHFFFVHVPDY